MHYPNVAYKRTYIKPEVANKNLLDPSIKYDPANNATVSPDPSSRLNTKPLCNKDTCFLVPSDVVCNKFSSFHYS